MKLFSSIIPYLILIAINRYLTRTKFSYIFISLTIIISVLAGVYIYHDGFYRHLDAQNGLLFIFIPIYQNVFIIVVSFIAIVLQWIFTP